LPTQARARRARIELQLRVDGAHLLVDRLHLGAAATAAVRAALTAGVAAARIEAATVRVAPTLARGVVATRAIGSRRVPACATIAEASTVDTVGTAEAGRAQRRHLGAQIVELLLLRGMRLEHVFNVLAIGVGNLRAEATTIAA